MPLPPVYLECSLGISTHLHVPRRHHAYLRLCSIEVTPQQSNPRTPPVTITDLRAQVAAVRVQAVGALRPFQFELEAGDDEEALAEDKVRSELMRVMVSDSSPDARQAALAAVTKTIGMFDKVKSECSRVVEYDVPGLFSLQGARQRKEDIIPGPRQYAQESGVDNAGTGVVWGSRVPL